MELIEPAKVPHAGGVPEDAPANTLGIRRSMFAVDDKVTARVETTYARIEWRSENPPDHPFWTPSLVAR